MEPKMIAQNVLKAWEDGDLQKAASLITDDFSFSGLTPEPVGKEAFLGTQKVHNDAFEWAFNPRNIRTAGNQVDCDIQIHAKHTGTYDVRPLGLPVSPIPATGKSRDWPVEHLTFTIRGDQICRLDVKSGPGGGVPGTLEWLGVKMPA